ncbi:superfamily II DNA or RNA helicase [Actinoplanes campanulatus]|uniref:Superfamily II DNA or RNA helicase n=1 Tax=Actinoplanes campanulatus TaxID=113559 RepID=A0A7W5FI30_9ACTN|nr:DEAD/DEAH box helicase family protein [Actinoplanes campanulatus]MBB3099087.1 superfamily II DNA or RNA helicase [Actinoplanes campanulatus]GGN39100.1 hypothetical protein GCM10010109_66650 [Actinoplanes campanulatus]GID40244.1 hypothetical protein Aca09nite_67500 [Actinoplanes campanulatus]
MSSDRDPRRRFSNRQRNLLYISSDGTCEECGNPLPPGWHADHKKAHTHGGATELVNGQALCAGCNLRKGAQPMAYADTFKPRPFQGEVVKSVLDGFSSDRKTTVVLASPGSGKTLTYQAVATYLYREGLIDYAAVFVPRLVLARQCEVSWLHRLDQPEPNGNIFGGDHRLFDSRSRLSAFRHVPNRLPLIPPGERGVGMVTTYSALVKSPDIYIDHWAAKNKGRFLLVADEAQFCGTSGDDDETGGTAAGRWMREMHEYAAHTLLLTGTPYRSDGQPLILADYEPEDEEGKRKLVHHAEAGYATGIAEGYLRRFEATMIDARVRYKYVDNTVNEYDLSLSGADLREVMCKPDVWKPIADEVVAAVREKQRLHRSYRGLISCMQQSEAKAVEAYLRRQYPDLKVMISVSGDGEEAERSLRNFKSQAADVLVTVRKAFIGYDCPEITVVGVLTNYRDWGHLSQLVGRGLRMWKGAERRGQSCRVICPDDPEMTRFIEFMRGESEQGLRERARREADADREAGASRTREDELGWVESAHATQVRAVGNDSEVDADELMLIRAIKHDIDSVEDVTKLKEFAEKLGLRLSEMAATRADVPEQALPVSTAAPLTEQEQIKAINRETSKAITSYLARRGMDPKHPQFRANVKRVTASVNAAAGCYADDVWTVEQALKRLNTARSLPEEAIV